jgi:hypothetical protein
MAITFQKQPLKYFNVNEPAIFEFVSDADLGVNPTDLVADLLLKSNYSDREYTVKNILPKYESGVFRIDVSGYLKSLMLDNFEFDFNSSNKQYTVESYQVGVSIHSENGADIFGDEYVFDSGYIFDTTFVFAEQTPNDNTGEGTEFFPIMGQSKVAQPVKAQYDEGLNNILAPKYVEFAEGFTNTLSIFVHDNTVGPGGSVSVGGVASSIPHTLGVATALISDAQIAEMYLPALITTSLNNPAIPVYGIRYKEDDCENTLQFRYFTSYGGYCYFFAPKAGTTANRGKSDFINNAFYNAQELTSAQRQREVEYKETLPLSGVKQLELEEAFKELLASPKVEVLLPRGYTECEVSGNMNLRKFDFEYSLNVAVANPKGITL